MNIDLEPYKNNAPIFKLLDGRLVVGEVPDANNQMMYVIKDGNNFTVESAWNQQVIEHY